MTSRARVPSELPSVQSISQVPQEFKLDVPGPGATPPHIALLSPLQVYLSMQMCSSQFPAGNTNLSDV